MYARVTEHITDGPDLPAVLRDRRKKLEQIEAAGREPYARGYRRTHTSAEARELLGDAERTDAVRIAGRLMVRRGQGGIVFADLKDGAGRIQLVANRDVLGDEAMDRFNDIDAGDIIGVEGPVFRTRRGEVSIEVQAFDLLSKALRPLPEKFHGLKDVETRYRQRYVDLIANSEVRRVFEARSRVIAGIRRFMDAKGYLEVETPVLHEIPGGGMARPFKTHHQSLHRDLYLRIALELHLKRLVVGGLERVYEIGRLFRNEGLDQWHNPEFTMLESYEAYADYEDVMRLVEDMVVAAAAAADVPLQLTYQGQELHLHPPYRRVPMADVVREVTGRELTGVELNEAFETSVQHTLIQPTFVTDYPVEVSPLARRRDDDPGFVERFELFMVGTELANAFTELTDPIEQRSRFENQQRLDDGHAVDEDYLRALEYGLPPTGGLGVGLDRLVMILTDQPAIRDVILFPQLREARETGP
jgi:lysyl-tRNA synthetase class 2